MKILKHGLLISCAMLSLHLCSAHAGEKKGLEKSNACLAYLIDLDSVFQRFLVHFNEKITERKQFEDIVSLNRFLALRLQDRSMSVVIAEDQSLSIKILHQIIVYSHGFEVKIPEIRISKEFANQLMAIDAPKGLDFINDSFFDFWLDVAADLWPSYEFYSNPSTENLNIWNKMKKNVEWKNKLKPTTIRKNFNQTVAVYLFANLLASGKGSGKASINWVAQQLGNSTLEVLSTDPLFEIRGLRVSHFESFQNEKIAQDQSLFEKVFPNPELARRYIQHVLDVNYEQTAEPELYKLAYFAKLIDTGAYREVYLELGERAALLQFISTMSEQLQDVPGTKPTKITETKVVLERSLSKARMRYDLLYNLIDKHIRELP